MRICLVLVAVLVGCGGDDTGSSGPPVPVEEFPARFAAAWCDLQSRCCLASGGTPQGMCETEREARASDIATKAAAAGATWNGAVAARCLAGIATAECGVESYGLRVLLAQCDDVWIGTTPSGGACETFETCERPGEPGSTDGIAICANNICRPAGFVPLGSACSLPAGVACEPGEGKCDATTSMCIALPDIGEMCSAGDCRAGAVCDSSNQFCERALAFGETCSSYPQCESGSCDAGKCTSTFAADSDYCAFP